MCWKQKCWIEQNDDTGDLAVVFRNCSLNYIYVYLTHKGGKEMQYNNILSTLCNIMDRLQDEESRTIFEARINYLFSGSEEEYYKVI